jgi:hypothetical protein
LLNDFADALEAMNKAMPVSGSIERDTEDAVTELRKTAERVDRKRRSHRLGDFHTWISRNRQKTVCRPDFGAMIEPRQSKGDSMTAFKITLPMGIAVFIAGLVIGFTNVR